MKPGAIHKYFGKLVIVCLFAILIGCNNESANNNRTDTLPGVVQPPVPDTSAVKRLPPVGDSNVIDTDSTGISR